MSNKQKNKTFIESDDTFFDCINFYRIYKYRDDLNSLEKFNSQSEIVK